MYLKHTWNFYLTYNILQTQTKPSWKISGWLHRRKDIPKQLGSRRRMSDPSPGFVTKTRNITFNFRSPCFNQLCFSCVHMLALRAFLLRLCISSLGLRLHQAGFYSSKHTWKLQRHSVFLAALLISHSQQFIAALDNRNQTSTCSKECRREVILFQGFGTKPGCVSGKLKNHYISIFWKSFKWLTENSAFSLRKVQTVLNYPHGTGCAELLSY